MTFLNVLNKFARNKKKKYLRANHSCFVNKELNNATIQRQRLRNAYLKDKIRAARIACKKNTEMRALALCVNLKNVTMKI